MKKYIALLTFILLLGVMLIGCGDDMGQKVDQPSNQYPVNEPTDEVQGSTPQPPPLPED